MGQTFAEKIIAAKPDIWFERAIRGCGSGRMMATDTTAPLAIRALKRWGEEAARPDRTVLVIDHATPCPNERIANLHRLMRDFVRVHGAVLYDQNCGVCHQ
jgi:3-isopropylmalate/(R)-2-methylmalate dehydratase large subunit